MPYCAPCCTPSSELNRDPESLTSQTGSASVVIPKRVRMIRSRRVAPAHQSARLLREHPLRHRSLLFILLLVIAAIVGAPGAPRHGGKSANPFWLYSWARPKAVIVSQRMPAVGSSDALTPLERRAIPLLRTWKHGAIHFRWSPDRILAQGFLDRDDPPPPAGLGSRGKLNRHRLPLWPGS